MMEFLYADDCLIYLYMKILTKIHGSFSSEVFLVERGSEQFVLKRGDIAEVISEKKFSDVLADHGIPSLKYFEDTDVKENELVLEYIPGSPVLGEMCNEMYSKRWGEVTRKMHQISYPTCFRYNEKGEQSELKWADYMEQKLEKAFRKAEENDYYGFDEKSVGNIREYLALLQDYEPEQYSLVHADLHSNNVLIRDGELVLFDKNPDVFSGDPLLDLAIIMMDMPHGTLIDEGNSEDEKCLEAFIDGYGEDFLQNEMLNVYVLLIAFGRMYTPYADGYAEIVKKSLESA
ncbi:MAG: aminoglycoside phosphotransferase family protein [Candidatus Gracilibacteria bacterium]|nr:aminoglycoside phosphotransferase family protein [Candidatus Gracilibacteria bacterium]